MCIRDRSKQPNEVKNHVNRARESLLDVISTVCGISQRPVSYTHLDVYKRQTVWGQLARGVLAKTRGVKITDNVFRGCTGTAIHVLSLIHI